MNLPAVFLVAGWSITVAAVTVVAGSIVARTAWNRGIGADLRRAIHELRRPLQLIALRIESPVGEEEAAALRTDVELARLALLDLERCVERYGNGAETVTGVPGGEVAAAEVARVIRGRWREVLDREGRRLTVTLRAGDERLRCDRRRVLQLADLLISNAFDHGDGPVRVLVGGAGHGRLRIKVENRTARGLDTTSGTVTATGRPDPRRGHGLAVASGLTEALGGDLAVSIGGRRCEATVTLPTARAAA